MIIRKLLATDIAACAEVLMSAYNKMPWNYQWDREKAILYLTEYYESPRFLGFVACKEDVIIGAVFCHIKTWYTGDQLYVDEVFVNTHYQGLGCGKKILETCENFCHENNMKTITLMTNKLMPAYEFYYTNDFIKMEHFVFLFKQL